MIQVQELVETFEHLPRPEQASVLVRLQYAYRRQAQPERIQDLQLRHPGEWLAVAIPPGEDRYTPKHGYLLAHSPERPYVWQMVEQFADDQDIFVLFAGTVATKGFDLTFHDTTDTPEVATMVED